jgi:hypothetical protein
VADAAKTRDQRVDDRARRPPVDVGDEADPAGVAFEVPVVEQGGDRWSASGRGPKAWWASAERSPALF